MNKLKLSKELSVLFFEIFHKPLFSICFLDFCYYIFHIAKKKKGDCNKITIAFSAFLLAEATRFELVVRLPVRQFSKLVVSATHPNFPSLFLFSECKDRKDFPIIQTILLFIVLILLFIFFY